LIFLYSGGASDEIPPPSALIQAGTVANVHGSRGNFLLLKGYNILKRATIQKITFLVFPLLSGCLLFLSFPPYNFGWLAWIGLIPLFLSLSKGSSVLNGFLSGYLCGLVFFPGIFNWILQTTGYTYLHHLLLDLYLGFYMALFGLFFTLVARWTGRLTAMISAPFIWVVLEAARSSFFFLALPWGLLAHSQYLYLPVIQIASFTGVYGVSFWVVLVNSIFSLVIIYILDGLKPDAGLKQAAPFNKRVWLFAIICSSLLICTCVLYGFITKHAGPAGQTIKIAAIQGNVPQTKKFDRKYSRKIVNIYSGLSDQAIERKPDLIVWPETATPRPINQDPALLNWIQSIADSAGAPLVFGSAQVQKTQKPSRKNRLGTNSAYMVMPGGKGDLERRYDKMKLFPFGEYLPCRGRLPWSFIHIPDIDKFSPGKEFTLFNYQGIPFAVTICWENLFADMVRQFVKKGAGFIINITNEAWFEQTAAPYQFLSMNVFRAVENKVYVVRCGNTGISCIIDPVGRVIERVRDDSGNDVFVPGILFGSITPAFSNTFYTRHGNWLVWGCIFFSGIVLLVSVIKGVRETKRL